MKKNTKSIDEGMDEAANALDQMLSGTAPVPTETPQSKAERMAVLASEGKMRPGSRKWPKEKLFNVVDDITSWFLRNPDKFQVIEYFADPDTQKDVSYKQMKNAIRYREDLAEYWDQLMEFIAARVAGMALRGAVDPTFSKYYLSSRFKGWQEQSRVTADVNVTTKVIDFQWKSIDEPQDANDEKD
jgi:hypothetical protein